MRKLFCLAVLLAGPAALAQGCVAKPGYIGGKVKLVAGLEPVCGAKKAELLEGIRASYRQRGKSAPKVAWFEAYVLDADSPHRSAFVTDNSHAFAAAGYVPAGKTETAKTLESFGYFSRSWRSKATGNWVIQMDVTEPRGTIAWKKMYVMFLGQ